MTPTYRYSHASKTISQVASMAEPLQKDYPPTTPHELEWSSVGQGYYTAMDKYRKHLASLKQYPTTGFSETDDGKEFGEGEFEVQYEAFRMGAWWQVSKETYNTFRPESRRIIAVRISKPKDIGAMNRKFERMTGIFNARQENEYQLPISNQSKPQEKEDGWGIGDTFTTPETGEQVFTVSKVHKYDVEAVDKRSRAGYTVFAKHYITKTNKVEKFDNSNCNFAKWLNKNCEIWGNRWLFANGDGKDYSTEDIFKKYLESNPYPQSSKELPSGNAEDIKQEKEDGVREEYDTKFQFGDIVENHWASKLNPRRKGIVVKVTEKSLYLTDGNGDFWNLVNDKESKTKIIGRYSSESQLHTSAGGEALGLYSLEQVEWIISKFVCEHAPQHSQKESPGMFIYQALKDPLFPAIIPSQSATEPKDDKGLEAKGKLMDDIISKIFWQRRTDFIEQLKVASSYGTWKEFNDSIRFYISRVIK